MRRAFAILLLVAPLWGAPHAANAPSPAETAVTSAPVKSEESAFVSPYIEKGLPADAMRPMLIDPAVAAKVKNNRQLWVGDIMRIGLFSRPRAEFRDNLNFSSGNGQKIARVLETSQIWFFVNPARDVEVKVNIQDARTWGGDGGAKSAAGVDSRAAFFSNGDNTVAARNALDVREAYLQVRNIGISGLGVQVGRQVFAYGDQRMIGGANWTVGGLSYDGILIKYDNDYISSHLFGAKATTSSVNNIPNGGVSNTSAAQGDSYLVGWYNTIKTDFAWLDLYAISISQYLGVDVCGTAVAGTACGAAGFDLLSTSAANTQRTNLYTFGARFTNRTDNNKLPAGKKWDYTLEAAFQTGQASDLITYDATGAVTTTGRTFNGKLFFAQTGFKVLDDLRLGLQAFYSPGTENRTGSQINTFQTLPGPRFGGFPYLNTFNGISENMGMKNIFTPSVSLLYENKKWGDFIVSYFYESKATTQDAWYAISGAANSSSNAATSGSISTESATNNGTNLGRNLYQEVDLVWMKPFANYFSLWVGVGYLHAGDAIANARGADFKADAFMSFVQLQAAL